MNPRQRGVWYLVALGLVAVVIAIAAVIELGAPSSSARTSREIVTAQRGVVQSTVTGSGNVEPATEVFANFRTTGTLADVFVSVGQHVHEGQLLATLDPTSAQLAVNQAQLSLDAAEDQLTAAEDGSSASDSAGSDASGDTSTSVNDANAEFVSDHTDTASTTSTSTTATAPATPTTTTPTRSTSTTPTPSTGGRASGGTRTPRARTRSARRAVTTGGGDRSRSRATGESRASSRSTSNQDPASGSSSRQPTATPSPAAIASARAAVDSAELNLRSAQDALTDTKLYAPASGTVVSLASTSPGEIISAGSASSSNGSESASSGSGSGSASSSAATGSGSGGLGDSSTSSGSSSSGSGFAEIVDTGQMTTTVAFSESDITKVKVGQPATVTLDALSGVELAGHVSSISTLGTDNDGVVSYDATLTLDQRNSSVRPGMSASAAVITSQAQGVTLPNSAVTGSGSLSTVDLLKGGEAVSTPVVVGLKGDSRTQVVSGLKAGQQVVVTTVLPSLSAPAAGSTSVGGLAGLRARFGGGGVGGGGGLGGGGAAARFFGGGG